MAAITNARARVEVTRARANLITQFCLHPNGCGQFFNSKKYVIINNTTINNKIFNYILKFVVACFVPPRDKPSQYVFISKIYTK